MMPLIVRLALLFVVGACLGSLVNWAVYALAWHSRPLSPWSSPPRDAAPRRWCDRLPIVGWLGLRREANLHGPRFWVRPMLLEVVLGAAVAALYWWEVERLGLVAGQLPAGLVPPRGPLYWQFFSHVLLLCWMAAASLIDIDEKIIPDEITVTGTLVGLVLATLAPMSLLPHVAERVAPPAVGEAIMNAAGKQAVGPHGQPLWLEPLSAFTPEAQAPAWAQPFAAGSLVVALACYWLWLFALAPRVWRGRRGMSLALRLLAARVVREWCRPPLRTLLVVGTATIAIVWVVAGQGWRGSQAAWTGLWTALVGLVASGGLVWAVRLIGTAALRREAMGFGDVTLMMMVGTFLGWQASMIAFFLAPFAGLLVGLAQLVLRRGDVIPYGPFLCLGTATVVVAWAPFWIWALPIFAAGQLVLIVLVVCLALLGLMLGAWQAVKSALFSRSK